MLLAIMGYVGMAVVFYGCLCYFAKRDPHQDEGASGPQPESRAGPSASQVSEAKQPELENELSLSR